MKKCYFLSYYGPGPWIFNVRRFVVSGTLKQKSNLSNLLKSFLLFFLHNLVNHKLNIFVKYFKTLETETSCSVNNLM